MRSAAALLACLALAPAITAAQPAAAPPGEAPPPLGLVVTADVGGGTSMGAGTQYTRTGVFEGELTAGYELGYGFRPELGLALGVAPTAHLALRPGLHYALADSPFYVRGALDWSTVKGALAWRWLITGLGAELRLTDALGGFVEADLGWTFQRNTGLGALLRAGVSFRF